MYYAIFCPTLNKAFNNNDNNNNNNNNNNNKGRDVSRRFSCVTPGEQELPLSRSAREMV